MGPDGNGVAKNIVVCFRVDIAITDVGVIIVIMVMVKIGVVSCMGSYDGLWVGWKVNWQVAMRWMKVVGGLLFVV